MYANNRNIKEWDAMRKAERTERLVTTAVILAAAAAGGIGIVMFAWQSMQPLLSALGGGL